jgi:cytochrome c peroxidase
MSTVKGLFAAALCFGVVLGHAVGAESVSSESARFASEYRRPASVPHPADNAWSPTREQLGRTLFFDPRLSGSNWISCASCHNPGFAWGDALLRAVGDGMKTLGRRTPTILNLAWAESLFWDGRAGSLEEQALGPIQAEGEMNLSLDRLSAKLGAVAGYRSMFDDAYPGEGMTPGTVAKAIAVFERTVVSAEAPFDRWLAGDQSAISESAKRGFVVFNQEGRCAKCHSGWRFTDDSFHDIGVATDDAGRGALLKEIPVMASAFKTPTLRNVNRRAPYMHNGSVATLEDVVELYDRGGLHRRPSLSPEIQALELTPTQKQDLVSFLHTLSSDDGPVQIPVLPR